MLKLNTERMRGLGPGPVAEGFQSNYLYGLDDLCKKFIDEDADVLEIGSHRGISTSVFCFYAKCVVAIDPRSNPELNKLVEKTDNLFFYKERSDQYISRIQNSDMEFDLIYIDANHQYEAVKKDIELSLKVLKRGGVLSGHDMVEGNRNGVLAAVYELFPGIKNGSEALHRFSDSSWAIIV